MSTRPTLLFCLGISTAALLVSVSVSGTTSAGTDTEAASSLAGEDKQVIIENNVQWRQRRDAGLRREHGWLTLVGLEWLNEGENRVGVAAENGVVIPGGPDFWGTIFLEGDSLRFERAEGADVLVDGALVEAAELLADNAGEPTVVQSGTLTFHVIFRESYGVRVSDSQAATRVNFQGIDNFPIQPDWRVEGQLIPAAEGETIEIGNVLGQVSDTPVFGRFEFERDGESYQLIGLGDETSDTLWFIFSDRTSGHGTYGAGRFLYSEGLPENGRLVVDFNKAYNPPCAFNDYSTCPLPPQENRIKLAVTAGEKDFHPRE
ncbi:MAG TPA: DUF1684 domain-containing protein [Xanthomonadales bacterium]|nr:DUF1684 domain-containing protein [Xanthomonadales bacterium]